MIVLFPFQKTHATIINIPGPYQLTLQMGINLAFEGDTVLIDPGIYLGPIVIDDRSITVASHFLITQDSSDISNTILDGNGEGVTVEIDQDGVILVGLSIRGGAGGYRGGGIYVNHSDLTVLRDLVIYNNQGNSGGGINTSLSSSLTFSNLQIYNNQASSGGGIELRWADNCYFSDLNIYSNSTETDGAAVYSLFSSNIVIESSSIINNQSTDNGAGLSINHGSFTLLESNISGNQGSGIFMHGDDLILRNTLVSNNQGVGIDGQRGMNSLHLLNSTVTENQDVGVVLYNSDISTSYIVNTILWNNDNWQIYTNSPGLLPVVAYSDVQGGRDGVAWNVIWAEGNIDQNPLFINSATGDFCLSQGSPCLSAGTAEFVWESDTIVSIADSMYTGENPDMGAVDAIYPLGIKLQDKEQPRAFSLQVFPNPFNSFLTIKTQFDHEAGATIKVYDLTGKEVMEISQNSGNIGSSFTWNASQYPSGIYFVQLQSLSQMESVKCLLIK